MSSSRWKRSWWLSSHGSSIDMVEDTGTESVIPLLNVSSKILSKVIEYCRYHALEVPKSGDDKPGLSEDDVKAWDVEFVKVDQATLFDLILVCTPLIFYSLVFFYLFHTCSLRSLFLSLHHSLFFIFGGNTQLY